MKYAILSYHSEGFAQRAKDPALKAAGMALR